VKSSNYQLFVFSAAAILASDNLSALVFLNKKQRSLNFRFPLRIFGNGYLLLEKRGFRFEFADWSQIADDRSMREIFSGIFAALDVRSEIVFGDREENARVFVFRRVRDFYSKRRRLTQFRCLLSRFSPLRESLSTLRRYCCRRIESPVNDHLRRVSRIEFYFCA
jgi:hypothetical protein